VTNLKDPLPKQA